MTTREIRGVDVNPKGREPRKLGRAEVAGSTVETIQPSKYPDGQDRMGTNLANVHVAAPRYADGEKHREGERSSPYPGK